ncbi:MAG: hypothetical protein ABIO70_12270 [Pseudomonadota bacterium]
MDRKLKRALIYSALGAPGMGHWIMGMRARGAALMAATTGMLVLFGYRLIKLMSALYAALLADLYESGSGVMGPTAVRDIQGRIYLDLWWIILVIMVLYAYGIFDLYRLRKR